MPRSNPGLPRLACAALLALCNVGATAAPGRLHVPSPDWRDQILYFVLTDRFADGALANNDQGAGEFAAGVRSRYNGGDLRGVQQRLDYIRGLGATGVWITPPVANQWLDMQAADSGYAGYHGYWAENFMQVDKHLGTLADYQRLSGALHRKGMVLVQDIVLNHTGNFFGYSGGWDAGDPARFYTPNAGSRAVPRPTQSPFDLNDPRDPRARAAAIYHWTPDVVDFGDTEQMLNRQMAGLDDLNTENPAVRRALRKSYGHWISAVGVDAFRVDTAFYVPPETFADFLHARDPLAPGIAEVARRSGRRSFYVFGEGFAIDKPFDDTQARRIDSYMTGKDGKPLLPGMLNFPLYGALNAVFAGGRPTAELAHRIGSMVTLHARPHLMANFVDNHDVDRFLAAGSQAGLQQALLAMMTLPGIPVLYYGTEQGFTESRGAMFAAGWASGGRDHYDTAAPLYRAIAQMSALRKRHRAFSRGTPQVLHGNAAGPGAIAWRTAYQGQTMLVALNSADGDSLLDNVATGLPAGTLLRGVYGLAGRPADVVVGAGGRISLPLPARAGLVWRAAGRAGAAGTATATATAKPAATLTLDPLPAAPVNGDFSVGGSARGLDTLHLVVDGALAGAQRVTPGADGRWQATVDSSRMADASTRHSVVAWGPAQGLASEAGSFRVERAWQPLAELADPEGDDNGPAGRYRAPTDPGYAELHPMDLRRVAVAGAGGALKIDLQMQQISTRWSPPNGFDHVAFTVFIQLPGRDGGATVMPLQNGSLPAGMRWHLRLRAHGWSNALFSADGASADNEGRPVAPGAALSVDKAARTVSFVLPAAALGGAASLSGAKIYVTTWDYDSGYRPLAATPGNNAFGGGDPVADPKVMDDSAIIVLP